MGEQAERSDDGGAVRMVETQKIPPLVVRQGTNLVFTAGEKSVEIRLSALMEKGEGAVLGLLLWGILLTLHDLETDFRRAIERGEKRADDALSLANDPGALLGHLSGALEKLGIEMPAGGLTGVLSSSGPKPTPSGPTQTGDGRDAV